MTANILNIIIYKHIQRIDLYSSFAVKPDAIQNVLNQSLFVLKDCKRLLAKDINLNKLHMIK